MIAIDELECVAKRMDLIINNSSDDAEVFIAMQVQQNLAGLAKQLTQFIGSPNFKQLLEQFTAQRNEANNVKTD